MSAFSRTWGCLSLALVATMGYAATTIVDPTRPPDAAFDGDLQAGEAGSYGPQLQMIVSRTGSKPRAMISGEWVEVGGIYGAYRVVSITPEWVILKSETGTEMLRLTPAVALTRPASGSAGALKKTTKAPATTSAQGK